MLTSICGINWGDEGKGRMVDLLSEKFDIVCRYQGGNNAGHTVINEKGKFILNLLPSGILRDDVVNVLGCGMVIDIKHLCGEIERLREGGIKITPENLKISDKAVITMPYNVLQDIMEEDRLTKATGKPYGSTRRGIAPVYAAKYMKKAFRMGGSYLNEANKNGRNIMFEAQLGALRDIDFGIVPYTSSSSTIAAYAPIGAGVPNLKLDNSIGIMKAYSSCVGAGPFTCEYFGEKAEKLEYGAATGRPRRVGPFDVVASRYGIRCQGADEIALTKLDVLDGYEEIEICTHYLLNGKVIDEFPFTDVLDDCMPVFEKVKGWHCDITKCRRKEDLPQAALDYIRLLEKLCGCKIKYVSVGAEREACIEMY